MLLPRKGQGTTTEGGELQAQPDCDMLAVQEALTRESQEVRLRKGGSSWHETNEEEFLDAKISSHKEKCH